MLVPVFLTMGVGTAMAAETPTYLCVPETAGQTVTSGGSEGKCEAKNTKVELPPTAELATLQSILPDIKYVASGVAGKPTIQFDAVNVQVVNGEGKTTTDNGEGNLVIGYDENLDKRAQTGSHNLILGEEQGFTSYGGILGGEENEITGPFSSVTGGRGNTASGGRSSVAGGKKNTASGEESSVTGGVANTASNEQSAVTGGENNIARAFDSSVTGGSYNLASGEKSSVTGGAANTASGNHSSVTGGEDNAASGKYASIFGGKELKAEKEYEAIP